MHKFIVTDLDKTLIINNLEKEFLLYNFKKINLGICFNTLYHFLNKFSYRLRSKNIDFRFFYSGISQTKLDKLITNFFNDDRNKITFNKNVLEYCKSCNFFIIVSACSKPLVSKFIKHYFPNICVVNLSTDLSLKQGKYTGFINYKMIRNKKKLVLEYFFKRSNLKFDNGKAFGNYPEDLDFLKLFKDYEIVK